MSHARLALAGLAALSLAACKHADDPLEPFRKQCSDLQAAGSLKAGLTIDACAKSMKETSDATDPARRAEELAGRIQTLALQAPSPTSHEDLRIAVTEMEALGKPAQAVAQAHLKGNQNPEIRLAFAKALVGICFDDCKDQKFDCIVPALLESAAPDMPAEARTASIDGLTRCTGKELGDDLPAWTKWWASVKPGP